MAGFTFYDPGTLVDRDLQLVLVERYRGHADKGWAPAYRFKMVRTGTNVELGRIELRIGNTRNMVLYAGHLGYRVHPGHRGNRYAARSCRLLMSLPRRHGMKVLWITCNPDNLASRRTCELAGAEFVDIVDLPENSDMYRRGERQKCRYRLDL
jgi:predicted acetyltransferase